MKHFFAIASFGGFSKASRATGVSQPALSLGLQKLEKTLGTSLVNRDSRDFKLTQAGVKLLGFCQRIESALEAVVSDIGSGGPTSRPRLRIGSALSIGFSPLIDICLTNSQSKNPFEIEITAQNTYQLLDQLHEGTLDAALVPGDVYDSRMKFTSLWEDEIILVAGEKLSPSNLQEKTLLTYPRETPMRSTVDKICIQKKLHFKSLVTANSVDAIKMLAAQRAGVAFVLRSLVRMELSDKSLHEIKLSFTLPSSSITLTTVPGERGNENLKRFKTLMRH